MRIIIVFLAILAVSACSSRSGGRGGGNISGPIASACMAGGRSAANAGLCSCVQQAANQSLSGSEQSRAAEFFADPERAQAIRQSDNSRDSAFWQRYKNFSTTAEAMCRA